MWPTHSQIYGYLPLSYRLSHPISPKRWNSVINGSSVSRKSRLLSPCGSLVSGESRPLSPHGSMRDPRFPFPWEKESKFQNNNPTVTVNNVIPQKSSKKMDMDFLCNLMCMNMMRHEEKESGGWGLLLLQLAIITCSLTLLKPANIALISLLSVAVLPMLIKKHFPENFSLPSTVSKLITSKYSKSVEASEVVMFSDVGGHDEAKNQLQEIIEFLRNPNKYMKLGAQLPGGVILDGPGTGKTPLAKAVAGEAGVPLISCHASKFVSMGASGIRDLFVQAKKKAPSIVFIDEVDVLGKETLNRLITEINRVDNSSGVIVFVATNQTNYHLGRFTRVIMDMEEEEDVSSSTTSKERSFVWDYFVKEPVGEDGIKKASCTSCRRLYIISGNSGTSNMIQHIPKCFTIDESAPTRKRIKLDQAMYREKMAIAIIKHNYPFCFAEHEATRELHNFLHSDAKHITRNTAKSDVLRIFEREKAILKKELEKVTSRVCLTSDLWTSITTDGYMSLTAHYVDERCHLKKKVLNFRVIPPPHSGPILAEHMINFLTDWGIEKKVFTITLDNATYNNGFVDSLKDHLRLITR